MPIYAARVAVYGAIMCTMWFNGAYAWSKGEALGDRLGMVALALVVDFACCGFLPAASECWRRGVRLPALAFIVLWIPAATFSTFAAYASITANRTTASAADDHATQTKRRAETDYAAASEELTQIRASPMWTLSAACAAPQRMHREFCARASDTLKRQEQASLRLTDIQARPPDAELSLLAAVFGVSAQPLHFTVALWPALLIELLASLGAYAIHAHGDASRAGRTRSAHAPSTPERAIVPSQPEAATFVEPTAMAPGPKPRRWGPVLSAS